jgi:tetratricopeptide (TPR) repeat protein
LERDCLNNPSISFYFVGVRLTPLHFVKNYLFPLSFLLAFILSANAQQDSCFTNGKKQFDRGNYTEAILYFSECISSGKSKEAALLFRGESNLYLDDTKDAEKDLTAARDGIADNYLPQLNADFGMLYNKKGDNKKAIEFYTTAINAKPDFAIAYNNRGITWQDMGNYRNALADYSAAIRADSNFALAYSNRGSATYYDQNIAEAHTLDIESAIRDFTKALSLDPTLCVAMRNRGLCYKFLNKLDEALADLNRSVDCEPNNSINFLIRGVILYSQEDYTSALSDFNKAITLDPKQAEAYIQMGLALSQLGRTDEALNAEDEALRINKRYSPMVAFARAQIYSLADDKNSMLRNLEKARKQDYFRERKNYEDFFKSKDFAAWQKDTDFKKFTAELKSKGSEYFQK